MLIFVILFLTVFYSCQNPVREIKPVRIAISKATPVDKYQHYINWLKSADSLVETVDMYSLGIDSALIVLKSCQGLLLTGGEDVNPALYNQVLDTLKCDLPNDYRDSLEMALINAAVEGQLPIMAICRGLQILNVCFGGSLIFDIPTDYDTAVAHRYPGYVASEHTVTVLPGTLLADISLVNEGTVKSNHHQGIDDMAETLSGIAFSDDGLIESVQRVNYRNNPFLLGVQWHPERMDYENPLSGKLAKRFLSEAKKIKIE